MTFKAPIAASARTGAQPGSRSESLDERRLVSHRELAGALDEDPVRGAEDVFNVQPIKEMLLG